MIREIIRMKNNGMSNLGISKSLGKSRTTVIKYLNAIANSGFGLEELLQFSENDLLDLFEAQDPFFPGDRDVPHPELHAFFPYVEKELKRVGVTRHILWQEYKGKYPEGVMYSRFCHHYSKWVQKSEGYMPAVYKAGEKVFIDYAGKKLHIIDRETGEMIPVEVFVATLASSQYTYVEASFSQTLPDFINSAQNCLHFFGGVPACIIPDNLKSAVTKADRYEPFLNEQFAAFASHYNTSVMPTRALRPKDKSLVEGAVNITYTRIYAALRDREFHGLEELNAAIKELLPHYNNVPFQRKKHSRTELFLELERPELGPLPIYRYELKEYKMATVQKNCHVYYSDDKNYYSVPHALVGKKVKIILTHKVVEVYHAQTRVALHPRSRKAYFYSTIDGHMPASHTYTSGWNPEYFINWARGIGPSTEQCIKVILDKKQYPEQSYKTCVGTLTLEKNAGKERLENACTRALAYGAVGYNHIRNILKNGLDGQTSPPGPGEGAAMVEHENIRGAEYYN